MSKKAHTSPILGLIGDIKSGKVNSKTLNKSTRQRCVEVLWSQGFSNTDMGQILQVVEKTIARDLDEMFERMGISLDSSSTRKILGEFLAKTRIHAAYLMRLARSKEGSVSEKAQSEYYAAQVESNAVVKIIGLLLTKLQAIDLAKPQEISTLKPAFNILPVAGKAKTEDKNG